MLRAYRVLAVVAVATVMAGCAAQPAPEMPAMGALYVPSTAMYQKPAARIHAGDVLPGSDAEDYFIARGEKGVYGPQALSAVSAFTIYTYDSQAISTFGGGTGYRYRWVVQQGVSAPLPP